jgi:hypothetical protein
MEPSSAPIRSRRPISPVPPEPISAPAQIAEDRRVNPGRQLAQGLDPGLNLRHREIDQLPRATRVRGALLLGQLKIEKRSQELLLRTVMYVTR